MSIKARLARLERPRPALLAQCLGDLRWQVRVDRATGVLPADAPDPTEAELMETARAYAARGITPGEETADAYEARLRELGLE